MFLNGFSMYREFLKWHISQLVTPIEVHFVASPLGYGRLHDNTNCFAVNQSYQNLLKKLPLQSQCVPTIVRTRAVMTGKNKN